MMTLILTGPTHQGPTRGSIKQGKGSGPRSCRVIKQVRRSRGLCWMLTYGVVQSLAGCPRLSCNNGPEPWTRSQGRAGQGHLGSWVYSGSHTKDSQLALNSFLINTWWDLEPWQIIPHSLSLCATQVTKHTPKYWSMIYCRTSLIFYRPYKDLKHLGKS